MLICCLGGALKKIFEEKYFKAEKVQLNVKTVSAGTIFSSSSSSFQSVSRHVSPHAYSGFSKISFFLSYTVESLLLFFHQSFFPHSLPSCMCVHLIY